MTDDTSINKETSSETLNRISNEFLEGNKTAEELIKSSGTDIEPLSASELLQISNAPQEVRIRAPSILTRVREATGVFKQPIIKQKDIRGFWRTINRQTTTERLPKKFKYFRDKSTGKIYKRTINPAFIKATNQAYDLAGRVKRYRGDTRFKKGGQQLLRTVLPLDEDTRTMQQLQLKKYSAMKKMSQYSSGMTATANKFNQRLTEEQQIYNQIQQRRAYNTQPKGFVQQRVALRKQQIQAESEHARANSLLKAHEHMLTPKENAIPFLSMEGSILNAPSVFKENPENNILNTKGRPSILETSKGGNTINF